MVAWFDRQQFSSYRAELFCRLSTRVRAWSVDPKKNLIRSWSKAMHQKSWEGESAFILTARIQFFSWKYRWHDNSTTTGYCL